MRLQAFCGNDINCSGVFWVVAMKFEGTGLVWFGMEVGTRHGYRQIRAQDMCGKAANQGCVAMSGNSVVESCIPVFQD